MRVLVSIAVLGLLTLSVRAQTLPEWAYPVNPPPTPLNDTVQKHLAGSDRTYTQTQIDDGFNPPDWYPQDHPPMPDVVAHGRKAANARACALCHLTSGGGHPESALIAGLPVGYIMRQMAEFKNGARTGARAVAMIPIAQGLNEEDFKVAAEYFASLKAPSWYKVVETATVAKSYLGNGAMRFPVENGGTEPLGNRIIELPQDDESAVESRNPRIGFFVALLCRPAASRMARPSSPPAPTARPSCARSATAPTSKASAMSRPSLGARPSISTASSMTSRSAPETAPWCR